MWRREWSNIGSPLITVGTKIPLRISLLRNLSRFGVCPHSRRAIVLNFFGVYEEFSKCMVSKYRSDRDLACVAATSHDNAANPAAIMPRIKCEPAAPEIDLHPSTKIHRIRNRGNADVAEVSGHITGGDIHAAAKGNREVCEVAAHSHPLSESLQRRPRRSCLLVVELNMPVNKVTDCLHPRPS